jgi:serine/threonine-protein kinase HipA
VTVAEVRLGGRRISEVSWSSEGRLASFEYDEGFRRSGIEVAPLHMPLARRIYQFPGLAEYTFRGLPGMLADSLPDRFGNALIDAWLARQGRASDSFNPVERLYYVGSRGMGALEYAPATGPGPTDDPLEVSELVALADAVLRERSALETELGGDPTAIDQILQVGTSAGGARAKAVIAFNPQTMVVQSGQVDGGPGFSDWVLKLDGVRSVDEREVGTSQGYGRIEYAYHQMALRAGIAMSECRLLEEGGRAHFMTRRFDRTAEGRKVHLQSLAALGHFDFNAAGHHSQEQAVEVMRKLRLPANLIEEQFRRACFNIVARNQDDHVKNIAFLMDQRGQWTLSPAYDLTYSYNPAGDWTSTHQMSLNGKRGGFRMEDLLEFSSFCDLKPSRARIVVTEVLDAVCAWTEFAADAGVPDEVTHEIARHHRTEIC